MPQAGVVRKSYDFKGVLQDNYLKGRAAVLGNLDLGNDVFFPGAFSSKVLKDFLSSGFVTTGHDWTAMPVAMPKLAKEDGNQLYTEAIFHNTPRAQEARTVAMERLQNGLTMGLSVGFIPDYAKGVQIFPDGESMLAWAKENDYAMSFFDTKGIAACKSQCRAITKVAELMEYSIVPAPMNPAAGASDVKSISVPSNYTVFTPLPPNPTAEQIAKCAEEIAAWAKTAPAAASVEKQAMVDTWYGQVSVESYFEDTEEIATISVLRTLCSCMWECLYDLLYYSGDSEPTVADRMAVIQEAIMIFGTKAVAYAEALLSLDTEAAAEKKREYAEWKAQQATSKLDTIRQIKNERDIERILRDGGFSQESCKAMISRCKDVLHRDGGGAETEAETSEATSAETADGEATADPVIEQQPTDPPKARLRFAANGEIF